MSNLEYYTASVGPSGIIQFDLSKSQEYDGIESLHNLLDVDNGSTFEIVYKRISPFNADRIYRRYQQYHNGVKVQGGGYGTGSFIPDEPSEPCDEVTFMLSPFINSGIIVSTGPSIQKSALDAIVNSENGSHAELVITLNMRDDCQYHLTWKTDYANNGNKTSWVDAHTGAILKTVETDAHLNAPTATYGTQALDDSTMGGVTSLISADGKVRTYDFFGSSCPASAGSWDATLIPTTTNAQWTSGVAHSSVYQAHHVTTSVVPHMENAGISFDEVHIAACNVNDAASIQSDPATAFVKLGRLNVNAAPFALYEIAAHELTHTYLREFFPSGGNGNSTIHEAICDMVGVYAESKIQGGLNWVMGDDNFDIMTATDRDLQNPNFDCYTQVVSLHNNPQQRGLPLGHWFFLITTGSSTQNIPALGLEKSMQIALGAAMLLGGQDPVDYIDFKYAAMTFVDAEFGPCSNEGIAVREAFDAICLPTGSCGFSIVGPNEVCEEDDQLQLCASGGISGAQYHWTFPSGWTATGSTTQNGFTGPCVNITDFPKYNWYPKHFTIKASMVGTGVSRTHHIKLVDCLGDDPTCEEYHGLNGGTVPDRTTPFSLDGSRGDESFLRIYNLSGKLIYSGSIQQFYRRHLQGRGIFIAAYFDSTGNLIRAEKFAH